MQKVLIISRAFQPCHLTSAARVNSFVKFLADYGYYPVVVTRNWDISLKTLQDINRPSGDKLIISKNDRYEAHYIPFKGSLSYRPFNNRLVKKIAALLDSYFGELALFNPDYGLLDYSLKLTRANPGIKKAVVSVPPFHFLEFGYLLKKKRGLNWIADYRDEWNTEGSISKKDASKLPFFSRMIFALKNYFIDPSANEKKWLATASSFLTISPQALSNLSRLTAVKGDLLINGFDEDDFESETSGHLALDFKNKFTITYAGWLYSTQQIEILAEAICTLADEKVISKDNFQLVFIGGAYFDGMQDRISNLLGGRTDLANFTERVSKKESIYIQKQADLLLLCAHKNNDAIPSSKLYEYIGLKKRVLLCPSDHGIMEHTLLGTRQGIRVDSVKETVALLTDLISNRSSRAAEWESGNRQSIDFFSRKSQVNILVKQLEAL